MTASSRGSGGWKRQSERDRRGGNKQALLKEHASIITTSPGGAWGGPGGILVCWLTRSAHLRKPEKHGFRSGPRGSTFLAVGEVTLCRNAVKNEL